MIHIEHLYKSYGDHVVLKDYSVSFKTQRTHIILGESGCGKTTLMRILFGLETADQGTIENVPQPLSIVFQEDRLCENLTVSRNIRLTARKDITTDMIAYELKQIGLDDCMDKPVRELSGGMKRRVAILRALLAPFNTIVFDEAIQGIDEENKEKTIKTILRYTQDKTVFWITHDQQEINCFSNPVIHILK